MVYKGCSAHRHGMREREKKKKLMRSREKEGRSWNCEAVSSSAINEVSFSEPTTTTATGTRKTREPYFALSQSSLDGIMPL